MGLFGKPSPDKLSSLSENQIWPLGSLGLNKKFLWFPKTGYGFNQDNVVCREIDIQTEGTSELQAFLNDFFGELKNHSFAKMETWPNESHFNEEHYFLPQDATIELGSQGEHRKLVKLFGFVDLSSGGQAIYFSKFQNSDDGSLKKSLVKVAELNIQKDENAWFIINQITPKSSAYGLCLFLTLQFQSGALKPDHLYLHLPRNYQKMRRYLDKVGL